jgi:hypothetical protein
MANLLGHYNVERNQERTGHVARLNQLMVKQHSRSVGDRKESLVAF